MKATGTSKRKTDKIAKNIFDTIRVVTKQLAVKAAPTVASTKLEERPALVQKIRDDITQQIHDRVDDPVGADTISSLAEKSFMHELSLAIRTLNSLKSPPAA